MKVEQLSVCLITYNHENYIAKAIDSIFIQKTNFDYKIVIADDCSNDNTRKIIQSYKERFPDKIDLIFQRNNVGPAQNFIDLLTFPNSKYIAYLEGDDYWIDENKLQKQFDFLEKNSDFALVHSDVKGLIGNEIIENLASKKWNSLKDETELIDALKNPIAYSCTAFFRNVGFENYFDTNYKKLKAGDWGLWIILLCIGKAKFLDDKTAVYRVGSGVSTNNFNYNSNDYKNGFIFLFSLVFKVKKNRKIILINALAYLKEYIRFKIKGR